EIVMEPLMAQGVAETEAADRARSLLTALNVPERLWSLPPATFSGGEQQRVNIARGFIANHPMLLLDEPTASLDSRNREAVIGLIEAKKRAGTAILGIFHDDDVREKVADRVIDVTRFAARAVAA
ncbi:MAG: ATP-binding cassette domain-containing protein, partial [Hyphomicrobiales bacterium]